MEERHVTVDGITYPLDPPFLVLATQNPIEMEGTYPLPEAQRDRFTARLTIGYPSPEAELAMVDQHGIGSPLDDLEPVSDAAEVVKLTHAIRDVHVSDAVRRYAVDLVTATRDNRDLRLGASPRATLHLLRASRAVAALDGREFVLPDDIQALAVPVLAHRLLLSAEAQVARRTTSAVVTDVVASVPVPGVERQRRSG
jgi:MoxR-like ATPase